MRPEEREEFLRDGLSRERRANFEAGETAVRAWEGRCPWSLDDYVEFLDSLQSVFGAFPIDRAPWQGRDFRL